jgi:methyl-accepting chemotaxis protein
LVVATDVTSSIDNLRRASEETGAVANEVLGAADELGQRSEKLQQEIESFLRAVRAA